MKSENLANMSAKTGDDLSSFTLADRPGCIQANLLENINEDNT